MKSQLPTPKSRPNAGRVHLFGAPPRPEVRSRVGYQPEIYFLIGGVVFTRRDLTLG
ncbi:MAG TPA: hypothetical protein VL173_08490 [Vicinamibacterales bacterium]|nr:hypothetical protein [Vicinamibacterales bacterium]